MFIEFNLNPKNRKTGDCVVRAIAYATQQSWDKVYQDLCELGFKMKRMPNDKQVYEKYLDNLGWHKHKQPRKWNNFKYTVDEFIDIAPNDVYIVSVANHLTAIGDREIKDIWDCGHKSVGNYWCTKFRNIGDR